jgi:hypothetical protein
MLHRKASLRDSYAQKLRDSGQYGKTLTRGVLKRGSGIRKVSKKRVAENQLYKEQRAIYMFDHPRCERCPRTASELHHRAGREGKLLYDSRFFASLCSICHTWVHAHPNDARQCGLLI